MRCIFSNVYEQNVYACYSVSSAQFKLPFRSSVKKFHDKNSNTTNALWSTLCRTTGEYSKHYNKYFRFITFALTATPRTIGMHWYSYWQFTWRLKVWEWLTSLTHFCIGLFLFYCKLFSTSLSKLSNFTVWTNLTPMVVLNRAFQSYSCKIIIPSFQWTLIFVCNLFIYHAKYVCTLSRSISVVNMILNFPCLITYRYGITPSPPPLQHQHND